MADKFSSMRALVDQMRAKLRDEMFASRRELHNKYILPLLDGEADYMAISPDDSHLFLRAFAVCWYETMLDENERRTDSDTVQ